MAKKKFGKEKYEERILNSVNSFFRTQLGDPRFQFISATKVDLNQDYSQVIIYWDTFDLSRRDEIDQNIDSLKKKVRGYLSTVLDVRHVPEVSFAYDSQYVDEMKISEILDNEKKKQS
ncbi:MAG: ribosome-binding factor A [Bdellovibrionales bacterium]|nr:ribosome-binding factor A [Bdellovibrionales bacterium]